MSGVDPVTGPISLTETSARVLQELALAPRADAEPPPACHTTATGCSGQQQAAAPGPARTSPGANTGTPASTNTPTAAVAHDSRRRPRPPATHRRNQPRTRHPARTPPRQSSHTSQQIRGNTLVQTLHGA